jgi:tetratricopeptide (TPR) repeat protein
MRWAALLIPAFLIALALGPPAAAQEQEQEQDPLAGVVIGSPKPAQPDKLAQARSLVRTGAYDDAAALLASLVEEESHRDDLEALTLYGEVLLATGKQAEAVPVLERAVELDPERPRLHFQLAAAMAGSGDAEGAVDSFAKEIELNDDAEVRFMAHLNRSILLRQLKRTEEAVTAMEAALELRPNNPDAYGELATMYLNLGKTGEARGALDRGAAKGFRSARLLFNVGARLYNDGTYEDAVAVFEDALEADPEMAEAEKSMAAALSRLGRDGEARAHLERYLELRPEAADAETIRAKLAEGSGN